MSRRSFPFAPWPNAMPPFGFGQQPFQPMTNWGPMWPEQANLPFVAESMPAGMMQFGSNAPPRSYLRRSFDQQPDHYRPRHGFNDRYGSRQGYGRGDRKRPGPSDRSRSPASKRATQRRDGARRAEEEREMREGAPEGEAASTEEEAAEDGSAQADDLHDPADPTTEDTAEGNVEELDNDVDETAGPLGEEYLEEVRAYYCTLCKLLLKVDLKSRHCCTKGHYRRHRDLKRKEEATKKAKLAKEKAEEEEDDTYTITDEVGSDDAARAATDAAGEGTSAPKRNEAQQEVSEEHPEGEHDVAQPEASEDKTEPPKGEGDNEQRAQQEEEEKEDASELEAASAAACLLEEQKESDAADRNGCKGPEEDADEQNAPVVAPAIVAARAAATSAAAAGAPKAFGCGISKIPQPKVAVKKVLAAKATAAVTKPSATASKVPPTKAGTAANSAASTTGRAPSGAATAKTTSAPAGSTAATTAPGRGGMVRGGGRGQPTKVVRARKR